MSSPTFRCSETDLTESRRLGSLLLTVESQIALLARCRPLNTVKERSRILKYLRNDAVCAPQWTYAPAPCLTEILNVLARLERHLPDRMPLADLWIGRVQELHLEAELAECVGTPRFSSLARQRYALALNSAGGPALERASAQLARQWLELVAPDKEETTIRSDDKRNPKSLLRTLEAHLAEQHLDFRLVVSDRLQSLAATGQGVIVIAANRWLPESAAQRISRHEIHGHAMPRARARLQAHGLMLIGAAGCNEQEEGRALLIERSAGLLGIERQRELGLRHELAVAGHNGQTWVQAVRQARQVVTTWEQAFDLASRAHRGGGLFREACYLSAFEQLRPVLSSTPYLETWFSAGRMTIGAALRMQTVGLCVVPDDRECPRVDLSGATSRVTSPTTQPPWEP